MSLRIKQQCINIFKFWEIMGMKKFLLLILLAVIAIPTYAADIKISGDARVRPRMDMKDATDNGKSKTTDMYYMYRARVKAKVSIGDGWVMNTMIGHNGIGQYNGNFAQGDYPDVLGIAKEDQIGNDGAKRSSLDFLQMNFGYQGDRIGFLLGLIGAGATNNPIYDLHFYPTKMVDIPYFIFNTDAYYGGSAYLKLGDGQLNMSVIVDDNKGIIEENAEGKETKNKKDQYTVMLGYTHNIDKLHFGVEGLFTLADDSLAAPMTFGLNIGHKDVAGFTLDLFAGYSQQSVETKEMIDNQQFGYPQAEYSAYLMRLKTTRKIGPGKVVAWFDYANRTDKIVEDVDVKNDFMYLWFGYTWVVYSSDSGSFDVTPRIRYQINDIKTGDTDKINLLTRNRLELEFNYIFK